jgi:hypothetical protein
VNGQPRYKLLKSARLVFNGQFFVSSGHSLHKDQGAALRTVSAIGLIYAHFVWFWRFGRRVDQGLGRACYQWANKRGSLAANPFQNLPLAVVAKRERFEVRSINQFPPVDKSIPSMIAVG